MVWLQFIGFYTIVRREWVRMLRIATQVFLPSVLTTGLYFLIFGHVIATRIGQIHGVSYAEFIAPGLIMMSVIINAYSNVSTSLFSVRFQRSVEEMLVSPLYPFVILGGYISGGIVRGTVVAFLVFFVSSFFVSYSIAHIFLSLLIVVLVSIIFSIAGFMNAMVARNFDEVMLIPTFVLTPLTYLGGIFYSITMLDPVWQKLSYFNPIFYMVNALRHAMIGQEEVSFTLAFGVILGCLLIFFVLGLVMLQKGIGLRE